MAEVGMKEIRPRNGKIEGSVFLPGSKSMTHRALLMAALADSATCLYHPLRSDDTLYTAKALESLGCKMEWRYREASSSTPLVPLDMLKALEDLGKYSSLTVDPHHLRRRMIKGGEKLSVFVGNSGTTMRLLLGFLGAFKGRFVLDGTERMRQRPVGPVVDSLKALGVDSVFYEREGYPPLEIVSTGLSGGVTVVDARKSSQFLSSVLIAAPLARSNVTIRWMEPVASYPYVEMTLRMMKERGIEFHRSHKEIIVRAPQMYRGGAYLIEGDCSSASYFWATGAVTGGRVTTEPVFRESYQGDAKFLKVLEKMGCRVQRGDWRVEVEGPDELKPVDVDMNSMPDMVPTLGVLAAFARGRSVIKGVGHLRIKESDRLRAIAAELKKLKVYVEEGDDWLIIDGGKVEGDCLIETYDDHRIAMAFSLVGLRVPGVRIKDPQVVRKSFPDYWELWERLVYEGGAFGEG